MFKVLADHCIMCTQDTYWSGNFVEYFFAGLTDTTKWRGNHFLLTEHQSITMREKEETPSMVNMNWPRRILEVLVASP